MHTRTMKVGIVGCGNISTIYCRRIKEFDVLELAACADLDRAKAQARADEFAIPLVCSTDELMDSPEIDIVVNLTVPRAHYDVARHALESGKHVYNEKPLAESLDQGCELVALADAKNLRLGCAPDTFLGGGIQTCRNLLDQGFIGVPVAATAFMMCRGHETWHPDPEFYYKPGGGPMFDMGPYYLTALVSVLGPVKRVAGCTSVSFDERTITSTPKHGQVISVETPTHIAGLLEFQNGAIASIITSFDVYGAQLPCIEIYGSEGTLSMPDPNAFGGPVRVYKPGEYDWDALPLTHGHCENFRGLGVADMAYAAQLERPHRANGAMACHVLEIMHAFLRSNDANAYIELESTCERPAPLPCANSELILAR
jgi:predicted dehydrogenase